MERAVTLDYPGAEGGRPFDMRPKNITVPEVMRELGEGRPVRIVLEPGDATRYEFAVVPCTGTMRGFNHYDPSADYLLHVPGNLAVQQEEPIMVGSQFFAPDILFRAYRNPHTRKILGAFYRTLWARIEG